MSDGQPSDEALFAAVAESNPDASDEEAAAIVAVLRAQLDAEAAAHEAVDGQESTSDGWQGQRWAFKGRITSLQHRPKRVPKHAPENPWTASGRTDRF
jgi:hypothetical protein